MFQEEPEQERWLRMARAGDLDALEELLRREGPRIQRSLSIASEWKTVLDQEDVMQATYLEAFLDIESYRGDVAGFGAWLQRLAENNLRDVLHYLESEKRPPAERRVQASSGASPWTWLLELATGAMLQPAARIKQAELERILEDELERLPRDYEIAVRAVYLEGNSLGEVAERMGRSYGAVYLLQKLGLDRLRIRMGHFSDHWSR